MFGSLSIITSEESMKRKKYQALKIISAVLVVGCFSLALWRFWGGFLDVFASLTVKSAGLYLSNTPFLLSSDGKDEAEKTTKPKTTENGEKETEAKTRKGTEEEKTETVLKTDSFTKTPADIEKLMKEAAEKAKKEKKDGKISEWTYTNEGVTDSFGVVKVKNVNKTQIDIESLLQKKADLSVSKKKPSVLIFHTHTSETYQLVDRSWYPTGNVTRSSDSSRNMVRVGKAICEQLEKNGYSYIHDTDIYDGKYTGAYYRSYDAAVEYLKKNPSIQVVLDIHRDAIERTDGTKIRPVATVNGKKAAQVMIISGCQEEGNGVENLPDWRENLVFALQLQKKLEENFGGLMRPVYFCPREYNMNLTHCSLLIEVGSDSNTLEEAEYAGRCIGSALSKLLDDYLEK